nr:MAG TPA: hypothetical protein [Caudoviricetes sp.]
MYIVILALFNLPPSCPFRNFGKLSFIFTYQ